MTPLPHCRTAVTLRRVAFGGLLVLAGEALAATPAGPTASFRVRAGANAETLSVEAAFPAGSTGWLELEDGGERFIRDVEVDQSGTWVSARPESTLRLPECTKGCRLRYRFLLREAAEALANPQAAAAFQGAFVSPPSTWLVHPREPALGGYRLQFTAPVGVGFLCGLPMAAEADTYASASGLRVAPLCAFGGWRVQALDVGASRVTLAVAPLAFAMKDAELKAWVAEATGAVAAYYRRFPATQLLLLVVPDAGQHLSGFTLGGGGASILLRLGTRVPAERARNHWVLTHELMHVGFPSLRRTHLWMEEGMAVFGEPLVRVRAGMTDPSVLWSEWLEQGPLGLPRPGEGGLDATHTWARTYWGGAVFWLLLDVTLRERTGNARSADDVLRALVSAGGNVSSEWSVEEVIRVADEATGLGVFGELFHSLGESPGAPDLKGLFLRLGVSLHDGSVVYDDAAPLAGVRRAMVARGP
jgi:hypothetical protein